MTTAHRITASLVLTTLALSGCKVGPNHQEPVSAIPDAFTHTGAEGFSASSTAGASAISAEWWSILADPTLDGLIRRAASGSLDVRIATSRIREARAQRDVVAADAYPQVNLDAQATRQQQSSTTRQGNFGSNDAFNLFQGGFDASWEVDVFGRISRNVEAADADIQSIEQSRRDVLVTLVSEVARNYVELRGFQQRLEIARKNIVLQKDTLELTRSRFRAGLTSDLDVAQAESSLASVESQVPVLDRGVQAAIHRIGVLLGQQPTSLIAELTPAGAIPAVRGDVPVGLPSELLRRRPDIRQAEREIAAATARIGVATSDLFPRFSITGSFGFASDKVPSLLDGSSRFWSFGPSMRWPILEWGRIRQNIRVQEARNEQALLRYESVILRSFEDVENALVSYTREQARLTSLEQSLAANQRAFDLANQLYTAGLTDFQRVLDSQRGLFQSEDAVIDSRRAVTSNLVALYKALGGGWESFEPQPTASAADASGAPIPSATDQPTTQKQ